MSVEERIRKKQRAEKIEKVLNHKVEGESFIDGPSKEWKRIVLKHFNKIYDNQMTVSQLCSLLNDKGIRFNQSQDLVKFPIREYLLYISKVSHKKLSLEGEDV